MVRRNVNPVEGGPAGGQLEVKAAAYYLLSMLCECEPRGMPGAIAHMVKFQRGYEGHAFDDVVVIGRNAADKERTLEIQAKRTLEFTKSDDNFSKMIRQLVQAGVDDPGAQLAAVIARTSAKIERHYHQLLSLARKMASGAALRRALDAPRVASQGMRDFAAAMAHHIESAGESSDDETLWALLRRFQILVFDFESPGAVSTLLAHSLARLALPQEERHRYLELWDALITKAMSYAADGGEIKRVELIAWLKQDAGLTVQSGCKLAKARKRFADHSKAGLEAIDTAIGGISLERPEQVDSIAKAAQVGRFIEIVGESGTGKSGLLKASAMEQDAEARPFFLSSGRIPQGGWLALSMQLGFENSAEEFLYEIAASGCTSLCIDGVDRITDAGERETIKDLLIACGEVPVMRVVVTAGAEFVGDQRDWLPQAALSTLGTASVSLGPLSDEEAGELASADPRLAQLIYSPEAGPLTRNLYQLRQLLSRADPGLPLTEAALAKSWWEKGSRASHIQHRERLKALRNLARQAIGQAALLDISGIDSAVAEDLVQAGELVETLTGASGAFRHDSLRDWSIANLLREQPALCGQLPLAEIAPASLARGVELYARLMLEEAGADAWAGLLTSLSVNDAHGSWRRAVLLALVRSERGIELLKSASPMLLAADGALLRDLIRLTEITESRSGIEALVTAGTDRSAVPRDFRIPRNFSWMRLAVWLLESVDRLDVPVGPDILRFFTSWVLGNGPQDPLRPAIANRLYVWLRALEAETPDDSSVHARKLFADPARGGRYFGLKQEIRALFLMICDGVPAEAEAYLRAQMGDEVRQDVIEDILKFSTTAARVAPAAMADFTIEALIERERRYLAAHGSSYRGRLSHGHFGFFPAAPTKGPFLSILRASPEDGLRLVRTVLAYGLGIDRHTRGDPRAIELDLPSGRYRFLVSNSYFLSRQGAGNDVMTSALRALEAWGHERVEAGEAPMQVVEQIIRGDKVPAAFLAVAIDILLSHLQGSDEALAPFIASPQLLQVDWDRSTRDRTGIDRLGEDEISSARPSNADLAARDSRTTCLMWCTGELLLSASQTVLEDLRGKLIAERARLDKKAKGAAVHTYDPRWQAEQALRRLDPANWKETKIQLDNGTLVPGRQYAEPEAETAMLAPLRARSDADLAEMAIIYPLVEALLDKEKRSDDLVRRGVEWARRQPVATLHDEEEDFEQAQRWRAVVATAALVHCVEGFEGDREWARPILDRATMRTEKPALRSIAQLRYYDAGLAALGWVEIAAAGDKGAIRTLLGLACWEEPALIEVFGSAFVRLAKADMRIPKALLRVGIAAATHPEPDWDDPEVLERGEGARDESLQRTRAAELEWLEGGDEPAWPLLPRTRRDVERRRLSTRSLADLVDEEEEAEAVEHWFNHQSAGAWLAAIDRSAATNLPPWITEVIAEYGAWTAHAWGLDLGPEAEMRSLPTEWLQPFERLRLRTLQATGIEEFQAAMAWIRCLPEDSFMEVVEVVIPAADSQYWDEKSLPAAHLFGLRDAAIEHLRTCPAWTWRKDEITDSIGSDIAAAIRALHLHTPISFMGSTCVLPATASAFRPALGKLVVLTLDAPGLSFVSDLFLALWERAADWAEPEPLLRAAEAWMGVRSSDAAFWRDHRFGARLCTWLEAKVELPALAQEEAMVRVRALVDRLAAIGIPEALRLEARLHELGRK